VEGHDKGKRFVKRSYKESFKRLPRHIQLLKQHNPSSDMFLGFDPNYNSNVHSPWKFQRVYICLKAMNEGFVNGCKSFIEIDGCHLKGPYTSLYKLQKGWE
jgi:hypothetical protein